MQLDRVRLLDPLTERLRRTRLASAKNPKRVLNSIQRSARPAKVNRRVARLDPWDQWDAAAGRWRPLIRRSKGKR